MNSGPLATLVVAMDGPAGAGKSSASRGVAERLGLRYLDTGAMYRAMTWRLLQDATDLGNPDAMAARAESVVIESGTDALSPTISVDGVDAAVAVRTDKVTAAVSAVSAVPRIREILVALQRTVIGAGGIVVEGRDIGTVVAPDAGLKVYLTANPSARAARRQAELTDSSPADVAAVEADLARRDAYDSSRKTAPLTAATDAIRLDTTDLTLEAVVDTVVGWVADLVGARSDGARYD